VRFRETVRTEFDRRRAVNPRYSLRRFARALGVHHATLSRLLRGRGAVPARAVRATGKALGLSPVDIARLIAAEETEAVIGAIGRPAFRADSRHLAMAAGIPLDDVNIALHRLLRDGRLRMVAPTTWIVAPGD
jgi:transcriptional regulator with XRE-family HTH domain